MDHSPSLTTMLQDKARLADEAVSLLLERISGTGDPRPRPRRPIHPRSASPPADALRVVASARTGPAAAIPRRPGRRCRGRRRRRQCRRRPGHPERHVEAHAHHAHHRTALARRNPVQREHEDSRRRRRHPDRHRTAAPVSRPGTVLPGADDGEPAAIVPSASRTARRAPSTSRIAGTRLRRRHVAAKPNSGTDAPLRPSRAIQQHEGGSPQIAVSGRIAGTPPEWISRVDVGSASSGTSGRVLPICSGEDGGFVPAPAAAIARSRRSRVSR